MDRFLSLSFHCYISNTKNNSQHPVNAVEGNREEGRRKRRRDGRKVMTNLDSIFKSRDINLPTKVRLVKATVFLGSCMDVRVGL